MNYMEQIAAIEKELEEIRAKKNILVKEMKYEKAGELRDLEKLKENEISKIKQEHQNKGID